MISLRRFSFDIDIFALKSKWGYLVFYIPCRCAPLANQPTNREHVAARCRVLKICKYLFAFKTSKTRKKREKEREKKFQENHFKNLIMKEERERAQKVRA